MGHAEPLVRKQASPIEAPIKGRGTNWMIEHRFSKTSHEAFDDGWGTIDQDSTDEPPPTTEIIEERVQVDRLEQRLPTSRSI